MSQQSTQSKTSSETNAGTRAATNAAGQPSPSGEATEARSPIEFVMVGGGDLAECPFWISFYSPGKMSPMSALSYKGSIADSLATFSREGIAYSDPFVTINAEMDPPQHLYMFPLEQLQKQLKEPVDALLTNISSFKPSKVGLYLTDAEEKSLTVYDLYHDLVAEVLSNPHVKSLYFHCPDHGYHSVLNLISKVKQSLEAKHGPIYIVH